MPKGKILIVDDERLITESLEKILSTWGYEVASYNRAHGMLSLLIEHNPQVVLLDVYIADLHGIEVMKQIRKEGWTIPIILMTAYADVSLAVHAMKEGATDFLVKPIDLNHLSVLLEKTFQHARLQKKVEVLQQEVEEHRPQEGIIGSSPGLRQVMDVARKVAASSSTTVLIEGESGTGKELIARYIYESSSRANEPFVKINCGAIPKDLAESEFFGYEKGAFTGAIEKMKQGKFELADGGVILLDEIGELSMDMQVKLLRVMDERKFFRLGGVKEITVDVRVIASTNRDLAKEVAQGRFREDLYYRLNVASIKIPPLRDRREDIRPMVDAFLKAFAVKFNKPVPRISPDLLTFLDRHPWKGNVRELRNAVERVVLLNDMETVKIDHFSFLNIEPSFVRGMTSAELSNYVLEIPQNGVNINQVMKDLILKTLALTKGNQVQAARVLGLSRSKLRYRIEQLGIQSDHTFHIKSLK